MLIQPLLQYLAILIRLLGEWHVARTHEEFPLRIGDAVVEGLCHERGTKVVGAAHDEARHFDLLESIGIVIVAKRASRRIFVRSPAIEVSLGTRLLRSAQALRTIRRHFASAMQEHEVLVGLGVSLAGEIILRLSLGDGTLVFLRHKLDHAVLLARPELAARKCAGEDGAPYAPCLLLDEVDDVEHTAPRLSQEMEMVEMQIVDEGAKLVEPRLWSP